MNPAFFSPVSSQRACYFAENYIFEKKKIMLTCTFRQMQILKHKEQGRLYLLRECGAVAEWLSAPSVSGKSTGQKTLQGSGLRSLSENYLYISEWSECSTQRCFPCPSEVHQFYHAIHLYYGTV